MRFSNRKLCIADVEILLKNAILKQDVKYFWFNVTSGKKVNCLSFTTIVDIAVKSASARNDAQKTNCQCIDFEEIVGSAPASLSFKKTTTNLVEISASFSLVERTSLEQTVSLWSTRELLDEHAICLLLLHFNARSIRQPIGKQINAHVTSKPSIQTKSPNNCKYRSVFPSPCQIRENSVYREFPPNLITLCLRRRCPELSTNNRCFSKSITQPIGKDSGQVSAVPIRLNIFSYTYIYIYM